MIGSTLHYTQQCRWYHVVILKWLPLLYIRSKPTSRVNKQKYLIWNVHYIKVYYTWNSIGEFGMQASLWQVCAAQLLSAQHSQRSQGQSWPRDDHSCVIASSPHLDPSTWCVICPLVSADKVTWLIHSTLSCIQEAGEGEREHWGSLCSPTSQKEMFACSWWVGSSV